MDIQKRCKLTAVAGGNTQKRFNQRAFFKAVEGGVFFKWGVSGGKTGRNGWRLHLSPRDLQVCPSVA